MLSSSARYEEQRVACVETLVYVKGLMDGNLLIL